MEFSVTKPTTIAEVSSCVDLYIAANDFSFLPANRLKSIAELSHAIRMNRFVRMAELDGKLVGWIYGREANISHMNNKVFQQQYYASSLTGVAAVKLLTLLHDHMLSYAEDKGYEIVLSAGSHMDSSNVLARVLAKNGWDTRGYLAAKKTKFFKEK